MEEGFVTEFEAAELDDLVLKSLQSLADDPHIVRLGSTTDRLGRAGVAVAVQTGEDGAHGALVLVIGSGDGRLLEWDDIAASAPQLGVDSPVVTSFQVFLSARWVAKPQ